VAGCGGRCRRKIKRQRPSAEQTLQALAPQAAGKASKHEPKRTKARMLCTATRACGGRTGAASSIASPLRTIGHGPAPHRCVAPPQHAPTIFRWDVRLVAPRRTPRPIAEAAQGDGAAADRSMLCLSRGLAAVCAPVCRVVCFVSDSLTTDFVGIAVPERSSPFVLDKHALVQRASHKSHAHCRPARTMLTRNGRRERRPVFAPHTHFTPVHM
jgi:hypothetical protein